VVAPRRAQLLARPRPTAGWIARAWTARVWIVYRRYYIILYYIILYYIIILDNSNRNCRTRISRASVCMRANHSFPTTSGSSLPASSSACARCYTARAHACVRATGPCATPRAPNSLCCYLRLAARTGGMAAQQQHALSAHRPHGTRGRWALVPQRYRTPEATPHTRSAATHLGAATSDRLSWSSIAAIA
jgi:hypothetical protein